MTIKIHSETQIGRINDQVQEQHELLFRVVENHQRLIEWVIALENKIDELEHRLKKKP